MAKPFFKVQVTAAGGKYYLASATKPEVELNELDKVIQVIGRWMQSEDYGWLPEYFDWSSVTQVVWQYYDPEAKKPLVYDRTNPLSVLDDEEAYRAAVNRIADGPGEVESYTEIDRRRSPFAID